MRERKTERYQATLEALCAHAEADDFETHGGLHAWERLQLLIDALEQAYDTYELEGDVVPVRRAIEAYNLDLSDKGLRADSWVGAQLRLLLADLEADEPEVNVRIVTGPAPSAWPSSMLAVHPETLDALMRSRRQIPRRIYQ